MVTDVNQIYCDYFTVYTHNITLYMLDIYKFIHQLYLSIAGEGKVSPKGLGTLTSYMAKLNIVC